jgi:hypothetical protein
MVNHEGKANRRFQRHVQVQSAIASEAPFVVEIARETPKRRPQMERRLV